MATHIDVHSMRSGTDQNSLVESIVVDPDSEHKPGNITPNEDLVPDSFTTLSPKVHATDDSDAAAQGQGPRHPNLPKSDHELSDVRTERTDQRLCCTHPQSNLDKGILPSVPEVSGSERAVDPASGSTPLINTNDDDAPMMMDPQEPPVFHPKMVSPATPPRDEKEADTGDPVLDATGTAGSALLTDEENPQEDIDCFIEEIPSSLPPSSSPPQLFSSSPYASSQSSVGDVEPSKMVLAVEAVETLDCASFRPDDQIIPVVQDDCQSESEGVHNHDSAEAASENDTYCSPTVPLSDVEDFSELSRKRAADPRESSQPIKRPNLDLHLYLPPTPKRATVASQRHQFKKLATPFRPPLKLSIDGDRPVQDTVGRKIESTTSATLETRHDRINQRGSTVHPPHRAPRSVTQFKSPLAHGVTPAESRTVRLTPAIQVLERKLQLLKRAIKVKENNEEEVLVRLAGKWVEAGREVAYDVWHSVKDTGDFAGKSTFMRRKSHGWESTNNANTPWGWDTKRGDVEEESGDLDPSEATGATERLAPEEDDDVGCSTLGTMLRQLGIAPDIFGWDDEKEAFSD